MLILVTYDVSTVEKAGQRRLRRVASRPVSDHGARIETEDQLGTANWGGNSQVAP
jgi:hypothetical protein